MNNLLKQYSEILTEWNSRINLMSTDETIEKHIEDVQNVIPHITNTKRVIDLGTGAGIPGIILKILKPELEVILVDSTRKKISFCTEVIRKLKLENILAVWGRVEDKTLAHSVGKFDLVISRATWDLANYLEMAVEYMKDDSYCIAMKGPKWVEELSRTASVLKNAKLSLEGTHPYKLSSGEERCLLVFNKTN